MAKILITPQTAAATSDSLDINIDNKPVTPEAFAQGNYPQGTTIKIIGDDTGAELVGSEYVKLQYYDGYTWRDAKKYGDEGKILDVDNSVRTIYGRLDGMRVVKSLTVGNIGVGV